VLSFGTVKMRPAVIAQTYTAQIHRSAGWQSSLRDPEHLLEARISAEISGQDVLQLFGSINIFILVNYKNFSWHYNLGDLSITNQCAILNYFLRPEKVHFFFENYELFTQTSKFDQINWLNSNYLIMITLNLFELNWW
jgi:hypothetical protein